MAVPNHRENHMHARIALISEHASPLATLGGVDSGGQNVYVAQLSKQLAARDQKVDIFTRRDNPGVPEIVESINGVRIIHVEAGPPRPVRKEELLPYMAEFARNVQRFCRVRRLRYDVLHANFWTSGVVALHLKRELGIPFVITFHALGRVRRLHQAEADEFPPERPEIEESIIRECNAVIAECPQDKEDLIHLYDADPARIVIIPCGFDSHEMWPVPKRMARRLLGIDPSERILLQLGRLVPRKGIDVAIGAVAILERQFGIPSRLLVVGGEADWPDPTVTPEIARLRRIAEEAGVAHRIVFTGRRNRNVLRYYYSSADAFITTPWYEPFGITPVEAMACGVPVIGSAVGGIKTTIVDGKSGFLVPPRDPQAVADRLAFLFRNAEVMRAFGRAGLRRANQHYTWAKVADRVLNLYRRVVAREAAAAAIGGATLRR